MSTAAAPALASSSLDFVSLGGNFLLVLLLLLGVLWALRRLQGIKGLQGLRPVARRLSVAEALSVGPRQKIALIRVDDREVLVGLTPTGFTLLSDSTAPHDDGRVNNASAVAPGLPQVRHG